MMIGQEIRHEGTSLSFEFFPPKDQPGEDRLIQNAKKLEELHPTFVSVTYGAGGGSAKNTRHVVERLLNETKLTPMPHLTCVDQSDEELKAVLKEYRKLGVENILALRGDPPAGHQQFVAPEGGSCYAKNVVKIADDMRMFSIAVAAYPEGHPESPSLEKDMEYLKEKIDVGADFVITQMFFNNRYYYQFLERAVKARIDRPLLPGIMIISDIEKIKTFAKRNFATLPDRVIDEFEKAKGDPAEMKKIGVEVATRQCTDLLNHGVPYLHFYTLNQADAVSQVVRNLGWQDPSKRKQKPGSAAK
jgi:methylenetetrahydrofolate reductase (NADPH)